MSEQVTHRIELRWEDLTTRAFHTETRDCHTCLHPPVTVHECTLARLHHAQSRAALAHFGSAAAGTREGDAELIDVVLVPVSAAP